MTANGSTPVWISPVYDLAGNMTSGPQPGIGPQDNETNALTFAYDAWNRLVSVSSNSTTLATYAYNGLNQRIQKVDQTKSPNVTTDYYYNEAWQVLEEQRTISGSTATYAQYVWDPRYIDAPVCRFRDSNADGSLDETLYYAQDANFNVTAVMDASGVVKERYTYESYGKVTFRQNDWSLQAAQGSLPDGAASAYDNQILFGGYRFDPESGLYHVRNRPYHPTLGVWPVRDPAGYVDEMSLYAMVAGNPGNSTDPYGEQATQPATSPASHSITTYLYPIAVLGTTVPKQRVDFDYSVDVAKFQATISKQSLVLTDPILDGYRIDQSIRSVRPAASASGSGITDTMHRYTNMRAYAVIYPEWHFTYKGSVPSKTCIVRFRAGTILSIL